MMTAQNPEILHSFMISFLQLVGSRGCGWWNVEQEEDFVCTYTQNKQKGMQVEG